MDTSFLKSLAGDMVEGGERLGHSWGRQGNKGDMESKEIFFQMMGAS